MIEHLGYDKHDPAGRNGGNSRNGTRVKTVLTVSRITDQVLEAMTEWQHGPLDRVYPVVFLDAIVVKVRDGQVTNRPSMWPSASPSTANATSLACGPVGR